MQVKGSFHSGSDSSISRMGHLRKGPQVFDDEGSQISKFEDPFSGTLSSKLQTFNEFVLKIKISITSKQGFNGFKA